MPESSYIKSMFDDISPKYDLLNDLLSVGIHRFWKKKLISLALNSNPTSVLDCATGTGDIAFGIEKYSVKRIVGLDFSPLMIEAANTRKSKKNSRVTFQVGDVSHLTFKDQEFDVATISFGIRNVENLSLSLRELSRVSKSLYILEFGAPENKMWKKTYFNMLKLYFPFLSAITKRSDAYEYLISSSEAFPSGNDFCQMIKENTNFQTIKFSPIFGGIAYIYSAER